ncbi:spore germination protein GerPB [Gorillibacterium sp. CAU 1737]|uniref:spore germination protein GerPB n=1 Tax=Gorillibacterium sp. CAU 1737 TaxID=3140362 RepID=UPI0032607ED8
MIVYQSIAIHYLHIDSVSQASVVQVGAAGALGSQAFQLSGGEAAAEAPDGNTETEPAAGSPLVPLPLPSG